MGHIRILTNIWLLLPVVAMGQVQWSQTLPVSSTNAELLDAVQLDNGQCIAVAATHETSDAFTAATAHSWLARIGPTGTLLDLAPIHDGSRYVWARSVMAGTGGVPYHLLAATWDSLSLAERSIGDFQLDASGNVSNVFEHVVLGGEHEFFFNDAALDSDTALFVAGGVNINNAANHQPNYILLMRLGQEGTFINLDTLGASTGIAFAYHAARTDSLMMISATGGGPAALGGLSTYMRFNLGLEYVNGFVGTSINGTGNHLPPDSVIFGGQSMTPLPSGSTIISGRYGNFDNVAGYHLVATRNGYDGAQEAVFAPTPEYLYEFCAWRQSHDDEPDGNIVTAAAQNFNPYNYQSSFIPSKIHIYLLDTMLNVICDQVAVDGADDGSYYFLNRVKATPDGGTLLMGSKMNVNTQSLPQPWIMKLAPWDCQSGIEESGAVGTAAVWPNPGSTGFTAHLNGPVLDRGALHLFNAQGQQVGQAPVRQSSATLDATGLAPGIYLYRITDGNGKLRAAGRWVKE